MSYTIFKVTISFMNLITCLHMTNKFKCPNQSMQGHCSTGQSPLQAVEPMEEE